MTKSDLYINPNSFSLMQVLQGIVSSSIPQSREFIAKKPDVDTFDLLWRDVLKVLVLKHLGATTDGSELDIVNDALSHITTFYGSEWYLHDPDETENMKKEINNLNFNWFSHFSSSILLALLGRRSDVLRTIADWAEYWFEANRFGSDPDPAVVKMYLVVASRFRSTPLPHLDKVITSIEKCRRKRPKLLLKAWEAALTNQPTKFKESLEQSVAYFIATHPDPVNNPVLSRATAETESMLLAAGRMVGMALPEFEEPISERLMTWESVGLGEKLKQ